MIIIPNLVSDAAGSSPRFVTRPTGDRLNYFNRFRADRPLLYSATAPSPFSSSQTDPRESAARSSPSDSFSSYPSTSSEPY